MTRKNIPTALYVVMRNMGGSGTVVEICKAFWKQFESDLRQSGDLFYTWQYDIRWAATTLRKLGKMVDASCCAKGEWIII